MQSDKIAPSLITHVALLESPYLLKLSCILLWPLSKERMAQNAESDMESQANNHRDWEQLAAMTDVHASKHQMLQNTTSEYCL